MLQLKGWLPCMSSVMGGGAWRWLGEHLHLWQGINQCSWGLLADWSSCLKGSSRAASETHEGHKEELRERQEIHERQSWAVLQSCHGTLSVLCKCIVFVQFENRRYWNPSGLYLVAVVRPRWHQHVPQSLSPQLTQWTFKFERVWHDAQFV